MATGDRYKRSNLFLVRVWAEQADDSSGHGECHGKVQRVVDGETRTFEDYRGLVSTLWQMLHGSDVRSSDVEKHQGNSVDVEAE